MSHENGITNIRHERQTCHAFHHTREHQYKERAKSESRMLDQAIYCGWKRPDLDERNHENRESDPDTGSCSGASRSSSDNAHRNQFNGRNRVVATDHAARKMGVLLATWKQSGGSISSGWPVVLPVLHVIRRVSAT